MLATKPYLAPPQRITRPRVDYQVHYVRLVPVSRYFIFGFSASDLIYGAAALCPLVRVLKSYQRRRLLSPNDVIRICNEARGVVARAEVGR